jgi:hypothetical protein
VRWSDGVFYFESLNPKAVPVVDPVSDVLEAMASAEVDQEIAADSDELPDFDASHAAVGEKRAQRREQVRRRVEAVLGKPLREEGPDYALPDGRLVVIYYSKIHDRGDTFLGVKNRIRNDDVLVLLLGDETYPKTPRLSPRRGPAAPQGKLYSGRKRSRGSAHPREQWIIRTPATVKRTGYFA